MILGTAGHIDHGKTALVRALTGVDTDRLPEEKKRGITIDLGFAPLVIEGIGTLGVVDVPGHENFVRTMLAGASGIDIALLVIAADESVMPQTREHLEILRLLRIPRIVAALTKSDLVDDDWKALVLDDVRSLLRDTPFAGSAIVPVSALSGEGIADLREAIATAAKETHRGRRTDDLFRMPVDRAFTVKGTGTVVTGTVWSGSIGRDAVVRIEPGGKRVRVRGIQSHGSQVSVAEPGTRAAIALVGVEVGDVKRGQSIVAENEWDPTHRVDVLLELSERDFTPGPRTRVRAHIGTADVGARISRIARTTSGQMVARLVLEDSVIARASDRIILRSMSPVRTVGGGEIIDPYPSRKTRPAFAANLEERASAVLENAGKEGISLARIPVSTGVTPDDVAALLDSVGAVTAGGRAWARAALNELENIVETFVADYMVNHPLEEGVSLETLRSVARAPQAVIDLSLDRLSKKDRIAITSSLVKPRGWVSKLGKSEQALSDSILHEICIRMFEPPSVTELSAKFGRDTVGMLRRLERDGVLERVSDDRYYVRDAVQKMVGSLKGLERGRKYSPSELREVLGVTRKYLIPFLEFCDRAGITERMEDGRLIV